MIDLQHPIIGEVSEVLFVGLGGLQIHRLDDTRTCGGARTRMVAEDLDDVVAATAVTQVRASLPCLHVHGRIVEKITDIRRVASGA